MRPRLDDKVKAHLQPVRPDKKAALIAAFVDIEPDGTRTWEQLWSSRRDDGGFELRCIPFFARGLALGDIVTCDKNYVLMELQRPSSQKTFRIKIREIPFEKRMELLATLESMGCTREFFNESFLGVSAPQNAFHEVFDILQVHEVQGDIYFETSNASGQYYSLPTRGAGEDD